MAKKTDNKTLDLIKEVNRQKAEITKLEKPNWKTNCSFSYIEGKLNDAINIHVTTDIKLLISMAAFLMNKEESYLLTASILLDDPTAAPTFTWEGFSVKEWIDDIRTRINKIQISSKKKKLEVLETRLNAIISPELRAELELQAIANELA